MEKVKWFELALIFTKAVAGKELVANSFSEASRSTTITPRHPTKLAPPMCFLALVAIFGLKNLSGVF